ncbi:oxidoreductase molybdopterin binding domain-containing protein [Emericellopsis atlantica]|uniref:Oxidoreductase molybdopterin binding domain-containing protein n=1 Tax=Emericellopsis atlantica TaxID=2614577 RepID=A0A9P8CJZ9_9HYPO|nr:oxidoreductase molybdopterin binding domain-containing protein [Emericellopsis atlantica]KAG9249420.1 oxidoreductase molybdopterin binding domain-containing protein [Emericellopsis atlantica]
MRSESRCVLSATATRSRKTRFTLASELRFAAAASHVHVRKAPKTTNRPDEWMIEQGMSGAVVPALDMRSGTTVKLPVQTFGELTKDEEAIRTMGHRDKLFAAERKGWKGFVEWGDAPEKREAAHIILTAQTFPPNPEYQFKPIPPTNPVLPGTRWKMWHHAIGSELTDAPSDSWELVGKEKHPDMLHLLQFPYIAEPPKHLVTEDLMTPNSLHFVRNHGGIPVIDKEHYSFQLDGLVAHPQSFTLDDLKDESRFPRMEKTVAMQCSDTRRIEQMLKNPGQGGEVPQAPWAEGAIGCAHYVGISLKKVIKACGGLDNKPMNYVASVSWSKVKASEVMLAWDMNGQGLPRIHGYPLRIMVFGYIGARCAIARPSRAPMQSQEYLYFPQQTGKHNLKFTDGIQIQETPVSSAIMSPWTKQVVLHHGTIRCQRWAYSGGGHWSQSVELSNDGGFNWYAAPEANLSKKHNPLNTQLPEVRTAWNWGLHVTSSCHRIMVYSVNASRPATQKRLNEFETKGIPFAPVMVPLAFPPQTESEYEEYWKEHDPRDAEDG